MAKVDGWKILKILGISATILGGIATAACDIPDLKNAINDARKKTPELPGPTDKKESI